MRNDEIHTIATDLQEQGKLPLIEIHTLRPVACALMNCGMDGRQKTINIGGITRNRLSSQSVKFAIRSEALKNDDLRTRYLPTIIGSRVEKILTESGDTDKIKLAGDLLQQIFTKSKTDKSGNAITNQILYLTNGEIDAHVKTICDIVRAADSKATAKKLGEECEKALTEAVSRERLSETVALFGRMATTAGIQSIYAACAIGHAYGINPAAADYDDFMATDDYLRLSGIVTDDDEKNTDGESGAAFMQTRDIGADVFYQYGSVSTLILFENLMKGREEGDAESVLRQTYDIAAEFMQAFILRYPVAHKSTMASAPAPAGVCICRSTRKPALSLDAVFEAPVYGTAKESTARQGVKRMLAGIDEAMHGDFVTEDTEYDAVYWLSSGIYKDEDIKIPDGVVRSDLKHLREMIHG